MRFWGNIATHSDSGTHAEALTGLKLARELGIWFHRTFTKADYKAGPFVAPPDPAEATRDLRDELSRLRKALDETRTTAERATAAAEKEARERLSAQEKARKDREERQVWEQLATEAEAERAALRAQLESLQTAATKQTAPPTLAIIEHAQAAAAGVNIDEAATHTLIDAQLRARGTRDWRAFQTRAKLHFENLLRLTLTGQVERSLSDGQVHRFDLGSEEGSVLIECKSYTWTKTGNEPAAKLSHAKTDALMLRASTVKRKIIVFEEDLHPTTKKSLAEVFARRSQKWLGDVEVWRYLNDKFECLAKAPPTLAIIEPAQAAAEGVDIDEAATRTLIDAQRRGRGWAADTQNLCYTRGPRPIRVGLTEAAQILNTLKLCKAFGPSGKVNGPNVQRFGHRMTSGRWYWDVAELIGIARTKGRASAEEIQSIAKRYGLSPEDIQSAVLGSNG